MRSVRLDDELENRLREAVKVSGRPASDIIRDAVRTECNRLLNGHLDPVWAEVIGSVHGGGDRARRTGEAYLELLKKRRRKRKWRWWTVSLLRRQG